jgi:uncharacterized membrane protein YkvA (DUF1232 family)
MTGEDTISARDSDFGEVHLPMIMTQNERTVRKGFWPKLARVLAHVPFAEELVAAYYCAFDRSTPLRAKGILLAALAYFVLPLDAVPDFILGLGFTDDLTVIVTAIAMIRSHMKPEHRDRARETLERLKRGEAPAQAA